MAETKTLKGRVTLVSWNVNGLRSAQGKGFLQRVEEMDADVLCVQETRASEEQLPPELRDIPGYRAFFSSPERRGYSGVAIYTRREPLRVHAGLGEPAFDVEGRLLTADYGPFVLCNVYFPNGKQSPQRLRYKLDFCEAFLEYAQSWRIRGKGVVVAGDFNTAHREIDLARPRENAKVSGFLPEERAWMDRFTERGFLDTFRLFNSEGGHYTWWDLKTRARERNVGWRIDYFFVSEDMREKVKEAYILSGVMGSDHCPVGLVLEI